MARFFPQDWIEDLRQRADIVQVIGSYTTLKRRGKSYIGLCPFHKEKTPSFTVSEDKQLYHCFGCKASGSVFNFIMEIENLDFEGAVKFLANATNTPLPEETNTADYSKQKSRRDKIAEINRKVALLYHNLLWSEDGKYVLEYFRARGLNDSDIRKFGLGASSFSNIVLETLSKEGYTPDELVDAWVVAKKNGRYYDVFRNRAMFPIVARGGVVLGFGARALGAQEPKYLNTHDTALFNKKENLYGANLLGRWKKDKPLYLVEGYMDVIALNKYGIEGAIATLGTSLTDEQAKIISRMTDKINICYDGDEPGQNAINRAVDKFADIGRNVNVISIPGNKDPDEYLKEYGKKGFLDLKLVSGMMFKITRISQNYNLSDESSKVQFGKDVAALISTVSSAMERDSYISQTASKFGFRYEVLNEEVNRLRTGAKDSESKIEYSKERRQFVNTSNSEKGYTQSEISLLAYLSMNLDGFDSQYGEFFDNKVLRDAYNELGKGNTIINIVESIEDREDRAIVAESFKESEELSLLDEQKIRVGIIELIQRRKLERLEAEIKELKNSIKVSGENSIGEKIDRLNYLIAEKNKLSNIEKGGF